MSTKRHTYNPTHRRNAAKSMIADEAGKVKGGTMKPELEALYEGLCRREPDLFEPEALHKQLDTLTSAVSEEALEALLQLCEDWQKGGVYGCRPTAAQISTACRPLMGVWIENCKSFLPELRLNSRPLRRGVD